MAAPDAPTGSTTGGTTGGTIGGTAGARPRVQAPARAAPGEVIRILTLISHPMETGLRRDAAGRIIPRDLIRSFTCRFENETVFQADLHEAMAANPFLEFSMRASRSGTLSFLWEEDGGRTFLLTKPLTVGA